jgi:RNA polymerase sigma-70 factor (ECF subfamily)
MNDERHLIRQMRARERPAFEATIERHYESVYRQHWLLCGDRDLAADLTQETFVEAWKSLPTFSGRSRLRTWLHTIAVRVWHRHLSRLRSAAERPVEMDMEMADPGLGPEEIIEERLTQEAVSYALGRLPDEQRETLVLFYRQEMKYQEIATATGVPLGTVKSRLHEGLKRLRRLLHVLEEAAR